MKQAREHALADLISAAPSLVLIVASTVAILILLPIAFRWKQQGARIALRAISYAPLEQGRWHNLTPQAAAKGRAAGVETIVRRAEDAYAEVVTKTIELRAEGLSLAAIAKRLGAEGHTLRSGKPFSPMQVQRILKRR